MLDILLLSSLYENSSARGESAAACIPDARKMPADDAAPWIFTQVRRGLAVLGSEDVTRVWRVDLNLKSCLR